MGMISMILVRHDALHQIEKSEDLGRQIVRAICSPRRNTKNVEVLGGSMLVVGNYFSSDSKQIVVAEGNTAWMANYEKKPGYSTLN
jgi:hypothetical protein